jgi:hypothetical protein
MDYRIQYGLQHGRDAQRYILVVSHMRSFSSLLCHILGSHGQVDGYAETHQSYLDRTDLHRLAKKVEETTGDPVAGKYVLDKILDNQQQIAPSVLTKPNVKVLFLVRNAEETIASILQMGHAGGRKGRYSDPVQVLDYYATRLRLIDGYSAQRGRAAMFLESERLIDDTHAVLDGLSRWLELDAPLQADYRTFKFSGVIGYSDPSPNILRRSIVRDADDRHRTYVPMLIPEEVLRRGKESYASCREALLQRHDRL